MRRTFAGQICDVLIALKARRERGLSSYQLLHKANLTHQALLKLTAFSIRNGWVEMQKRPVGDEMRNHYLITVDGIAILHEIGVMDARVGGMLTRL